MKIDTSEIKVRHKQATAGEWRQVTNDDGFSLIQCDDQVICGIGDLEETDAEDYLNAEFIVEAHNEDIPTLLEALDKSLDKDEVIQLIDKEIEWCKAHPGFSFEKSRHQGFIDGLNQAKFLIAGLNIIQENDVPSEPGWMGDYGGPGCDPVDI